MDLSVLPLLWGLNLSPVQLHKQKTKDLSSKSMSKQPFSSHLCKILFFLKEKKKGLLRGKGNVPHEAFL